MEHAEPTCPLPAGLSEDEQAIFHRVWRRVMPHMGEDCPIAVEEEPERPLPCPCDLIQPRERTPHRGSDFPGESPALCLSPASAVYGEELQGLVRDTLTCWHTLHRLSRRVGGSGGHALSALAGETLHAARRLAAAYFLISGVRWWPADRLPAAPLPSFQGTVRQLFHAEQQRALDFDGAARRTGDSALAGLYRELADQCLSHGEALRRILEQTGV